MTLSTWANRHIKWLFILPAAIFVALMMIFPVLYTARLSLYTWSMSALQPPTWVGLNNYTTLLGADPRFTAVARRIGLTSRGQHSSDIVAGL